MWYVYIIECRNKYLYTGITNDLRRRFKEHGAGKGAKFTRAFKVARMLYARACGSRNDALRREAEIKSWTRQEKLSLISADGAGTGVAFRRFKSL